MSLPFPTELCRLQGHRHDVLLLQFSHNSKGIATGAKDGSVRVSGLPCCTVAISHSF